MAAMRDCKHLGVSEEAYRIDPSTEAEERVIVHLCLWEKAHADLLINAPPWLMKKIGGSMIDPVKDCVNCPSYEFGP